MDYVEGCSLAQLFALSPDERPWSAVVSIFCDFLPGLHAAHELAGDDGSLLNLVHRDVSPQNVLIGLDGVGSNHGFRNCEGRIAHDLDASGTSKRKAGVHGAGTAP